MLAIALGAAVFISPYLRSAGAQSVLAHYTDASTGAASPLYKIAQEGWMTAPAILWTQLRTSASIYYSTALPADFAPHDHSPAPLLDPVSLVLALAGLGAALWNFRDHRSFLLLAWIGSTFVLGQMLTDLGPRAAYRAAPILPALAICGGWAAGGIWAAARHRFGGKRDWLDAAAVVALAAVILPQNLQAVQSYMITRTQHPVAAMARTIGRGPADAVYYLINGEPQARHFAVRLLGWGREIRDVTSLMDILGRDIDENRPAIFMISSEMATAVEAIRRCYPSAALLREPSGVPESAVIALSVSPAGIQAGRDCVVSDRGPGLLARYTGGSAGQHALFRERFEDWPVRFWRTPEPFQSVEWTGSLLIPVAGTYGFQLVTGGSGGNVTIGSQVRLSENQARAESLAAGPHDLRFRCESGATTVGYCYLRWRPPGAGDYETIAPHLFLPPHRSR